MRDGAGRAMPAVARPLLVGRLARAKVGLVEAPGGYGKTTVVHQAIEAREVATVELSLIAATDLGTFLAELSSAARRRGLTTISDAFTVAPPEVIERLVALLESTGTPLLIVIDEVQRADHDVAGWLADLGHRLPDGSGMLLAGRRIPDGLAPMARRNTTEVLSADDLRFSREDVAELLAGIPANVGRADEYDPADEVLAITGGWPAAVAVAAATIVNTPSGSLMADRLGAGLMGRLVAALLAGVPAALVDRFGSLARLPLLDDEVATMVGGPDLLSALRDSGIPIATRPDGWLVLPDAVRDELGHGRVLEPTAIRLVADLYARRGLLATAIALLHTNHDQSGLGDLLAGQPRRALEQLGIVPLRTTIRSLDADVIRAHPQLLVEAARTVEMRDPDQRRSWLIEAVVAAREGGDAVAERAAMAEQARDLARSGNSVEADRVASHVVDAALPNETATRGRALVGRAIATGQLVTPAAQSRAEEMLTEAIALFRLAGEQRWEADALLRLGYGVSYHGGRIDRAVEQLSGVLALLPSPDLDRGVALAYLTDVFDVVGRPDEAEAAAREAVAIGRRLADAYLIGQGAWGGAGVTAHRGDLEATRTWLELVERNPGRWMEEGNGLEFLLWSSDAYAALGDEEASTRYLRRAQAHPLAADLAMVFDPALARYEATFGDPVVADELLGRLDGAPFAVERARYSRRLMRAFAARRRGDEDAARRHAGDARREADLLELPGLIVRTEPLLAQRLADLLVDGAADPSGHASSGVGSSVLASAHVSMLGGFAVALGAEDITPTPGNSSTLLKLVAMRGTLTTDEAVDALWPEADIAAGRSRLRNLLNRVRSSSGDVVIRQGDTLVLGPGIDVDARRFEDLAGTALAASPAERVGLARLAIALYHGELLPGDRYEDWAAVPRERLQRRYLTLLDLVAADAFDRGNLDDVVDLLDRAIAVEPLDESRYVTVARALLSQGRRGTARDLVRRAVQVADELGMRPSLDLVALVDEVGLAAERR